MLCRIYSLKCILAFVNIPPHPNNQTLRALLEYQMGYPEIPLYVMGDLNCAIDSASHSGSWDTPCCFEKNVWMMRWGGWIHAVQNTQVRSHFNAFPRVFPHCHV